MIAALLLQHNVRFIVFMMLITINLQDKKAYLYRLFQTMWSECVVECQICFDRIGDDGIIIVSEHATLNLEKMFHVDCLQKWYATTQNRTRDPFNRTIKYKFHFPPKSLDECCAMLDRIKGFIGENSTDQMFSIEYDRINSEDNLDIELQFDGLLRYS
ncbi:ac53 [Sucra jujuba nucleopolyhedrovirus]|uniref:Ac53 n=1 Tax=Sucra jujuba nucleopolyhedrovirus TaxID=1563660 RepID=A0A097P8W9_9ABAC|nr:ac53 [Sucra jujuba nucleopolyhedrovirus]AIU41277.1 ac53 [Sucra jujuba nucleopolyhedrovirus]